MPLILQLYFVKETNPYRRKEAKVNVNVIVIGGGPAGIITALTAKSVYPEKSVCVIKDIGDGVIPCAIPLINAAHQALAELRATIRELPALQKVA